MVCQPLSLNELTIKEKKLYNNVTSCFLFFRGLGESGSGKTRSSQAKFSLFSSGRVT